MKSINKDLRLKILYLIKNSGEGHIPSSYSIVDIINFLYEEILSYNIKDPNSPQRDYFILSKGHGAAALYVVLNKFGFISDGILNSYGTPHGILGGHPEVTSTPGVEASTGSLGHGLATAIGTALGLRIKNRGNRVFCLVGDGECHEGTIWESANIAANLKLGNLCVIVDFNRSASQLMPIDKMAEKWRAFGWAVKEVDGHSEYYLRDAFNKIRFTNDGTPHVVIAHTVKGKGVSFIEGHGHWHHKIPDDAEMASMIRELS